MIHNKLFAVSIAIVPLPVAWTPCTPGTPTHCWIALDSSNNVLSRLGQFLMQNMAQSCREVGI